MTQPCSEICFGENGIFKGTDMFFNVLIRSFSTSLAKYFIKKIIRRKINFPIHQDTHKKNHHKFSII